MKPWESFCLTATGEEADADARVNGSLDDERWPSGEFVPNPGKCHARVVVAVNRLEA